MIRLVRSSTIQHLQRTVAQLQHAMEAIDVLTYRPEADEATSYKGNPYRSADKQVIELSRKYEGLADWGCQIARNMIDTRAAFTIGSGIKIYPKDEREPAERELSWCNRFIDHNNLDEEIPQDWAREAEIEGKFLVRLIGNPAVKNPAPFPNGMVEVRYIPWTAHKFEIRTQDGDYATYAEAVYRVDGMAEEIKLQPPEFVFKRFGGRTHKVNDVAPRLGAVLGQMENLDKALWDLRRINHLFASPTPWANAENAAEAQQLDAALRGINWKIGKLLVTGGLKNFELRSTDAAGVENLLKEVTVLAQILSGCSGVPVHFFGFPELLSNRATADNLLEMIIAATSRERRIWVGAYEELLQKAMTMANERFQAGLNPDLVGVDIPLVSSAKLKELTEVWLPLYLGSAISLETLLARVPEVDVQKELDRIKNEREESLAQTAAIMEDAGDDDDDQQPTAQGGAAA